MSPELRAALDWCKALPPMTAEEIREQRLSFAYGNSLRDTGSKEDCRRSIEECRLPEGTRD